MSEKVVDLHPATPEKSEKKSRTARPRVEAVLPSHIVEVWRLVEHSLRDGGQTYPDTTEDNPEVIRAHLFQYLQSPGFGGLLVRVGKRPVGVALGHIENRPFGRPHKFAFVYCFWIEPQFRKSGVGLYLWNQYVAGLKAAGVFNWESRTNEALARELVRETGVPIQKLMNVVGGRL